MIFKNSISYQQSEAGPAPPILLSDRNDCAR